MTERYMRADRAVAVGLWIVVFTLAAWTVIAGLAGWIGEETERLTLMVAFPLTALTAVLQVRLYAVRVCGLVRVSNGLQREHGHDLHAVP
jgi:hypothetical protein